MQRAAAALITAGNTDVADPAQIWGNPMIEDDLKLLGNLGHLADNGLQPCGHANYTSKRVTEGFYFRNPNNWANIYSLDGGQTLLVGDRLQARGMGSGNRPVVRVVHDARGGFTPQFGGVVTDMSVVGGLRRIAENGPDLERERQIRLARVRLLLQQHRQRVARPRHPARLRPRALPPGGRQPQLRRLVLGLRQGEHRGRGRVARRAGGRALDFVAVK